MGAYSSFAMLALTNHVLVAAATVESEEMHRIGHTGRENAVLGDDVLIGSRSIAERYFALLTMLGVEVNPIKGFSGHILEFAKQIWFSSPVGGYLEGPGFLTIPDLLDAKGEKVDVPAVGLASNLSGVGAKNVLLAIRYPLYITSVIIDAFRKDFQLVSYVGYANVLKALKLYDPEGKRDFWLACIIVTTFGPQSGL